MLNLLDLIGGHFDEGLIAKIKEKRNCHVVGDNLNIKTNVKDMRIDSRNKMHNWFMSMVVLERVATANLDNTMPLGHIRDFDNQNYIMSEEEKLHYKESAIILSYRVFEEFFDDLPAVFKVWKGMCPSHIEHTHSDEMSRKSKLFPLPMHFKDERKLAEMVDILCELEEVFEGCWEKSDMSDKRNGTHIPDQFVCPFSGDQLTRVCGTSARNLRAGCHRAKVRVSHTEPDMIELWHTKQNFLMV